MSKGFGKECIFHAGCGHGPDDDWGALVKAKSNETSECPMKNAIKKNVIEHQDCSIQPLSRITFTPYGGQLNSYSEDLEGA